MSSETPTISAPRGRGRFGRPLRECAVWRYYDPQSGQFISVDPLVDQTELPYLFGADDPVTQTDSNGLCANTAWSHAPSSAAAPGPEVREEQSAYARSRPTVGLWYMTVSATESTVSGTAFATAKVMSNGHALATVEIELTDPNGLPIAAIEKYVDKFNSEAPFKFFVSESGRYKVTATFRQPGVTVYGGAKRMQLPVEVPEVQKQPSPFTSPRPTPYPFIY